MNWKKGAFLLAVVAVVLAFTSLFLWSRVKSTPPPFVAGLNQNAYDDFARAASMLVGSPKDGDDSEFVGTNQAAFAVFRTGMRRPFDAPAIAYDLNSFAATVLPNLAQFKSLALAIKAHAGHLEKTGKYPEAAAAYLDLVHFGQKLQAGPLIFLLNGLSIEDLGLRPLQKLPEQLPGAQRAGLAARLEQMNRERIPFDEVLKRERYFARRNSPTPLHYLMGIRMIKAAVDSGRQKHDRMVKAERDLLESLREPKP